MPLYGWQKPFSCDLKTKKTLCFRYQCYIFEAVTYNYQLFGSHCYDSQGRVIFNI